MTDKETRPDENEKKSKEKLTGSKSDPQKTELEGLKKGGVDPTVLPEDKPRDADGKIDR